MYIVISGICRIIQMSLDKAIREIVSPVIQRSVTIASRTTKEMVLKVLVILTYFKSSMFCGLVCCGKPCQMQL